MITITIGKKIRIFFGPKCGECSEAVKDVDRLEHELQVATHEEIQAMRTLSSFRRQYHDGTGALVKEVHKLHRSVERLKTAIKERKI